MSMSSEATQSLARSAQHYDGRRAYLVGGGIASLAAAAFLIRDGDLIGANITIIEESARLGGSLDGAGSAEHGYVLRGGRMLESKYLCTYALFDGIPTLSGDKSVTDEIFDWNKTLKTSSKSRLVRNGRRETAPALGLSERQILSLERLALEPEALLGRQSIAEHFDEAFFQTNFWLLWCSTFAFQPWHSVVEFRRYLVRFAHMVSGLNRLEGIMRTTYNQFDSMVRPLHKWLDARGVVFLMETQVTDLRFNAEQSVDRITTLQHGVAGKIEVDVQDLVLVTLGSMTEGSSLGDMDHPAVLGSKRQGGAWALWERLAQERPAFGHPGVFCDHIGQSKWISFTTTLHSPEFLRLVRDFTGNVAGEGGLITFPQSPWLASIVIPHQPHFIGQPPDISVFWGYGLTVDVPGTYVAKPMSACSGREIMLEILGHLRMTAQADAVLHDAICIPCMMPFVTSQFLCRGKGDRPAVIPSGTRQFGFIGQFCEMEEDVVFTVEYSIRSAQVAVCSLLGLKRLPPAVYHGAFDPRVLYRAFMALHELNS